MFSGDFRPADQGDETMIEQDYHKQFAAQRQAAFTDIGAVQAATLGAMGAVEPSPRMSDQIDVMIDLASAVRDGLQGLRRRLYGPEQIGNAGLSPIDRGDDPRPLTQGVQTLHELLRQISQAGQRIADGL